LLNTLFDSFFIVLLVKCVLKLDSIIVYIVFRHGEIVHFIIVDILNNTEVISVSFAQNAYTVDENVGEFVVTLVLDRISTDPISVAVSSSDGTAVGGKY